MKHNNRQLTSYQEQALSLGLGTYLHAVPKLLAIGDKNGLFIVQRITTALQTLFTLRALAPLPEVVTENMFRKTLVPAFHELETHMRAVWQQEAEQQRDGAL